MRNFWCLLVRVQSWQLIGIGQNSVRTVQNLDSTIFSKPSKWMHRRSKCCFHSVRNLEGWHRIISYNENFQGWSSHDLGLIFDVRPCKGRRNLPKLTKPTDRCLCDVWNFRRFYLGSSAVKPQQETETQRPFPQIFRLYSLPEPKLNNLGESNKHDFW